MRIALKYILVFVAAALVAGGGHRLLAGRLPSPAVGALLTVILFGAIVALDVAYGW